MSRESYIKMIAPAAQKIMKDTGLLASLTMAQAILESDNGDSTLAKKYNNHFGIKGEGDAGSVILPTWEYINGVKKRVKGTFRVYSSIEKSFEDRTSLLHNGKRSDGTLRYRHLFGITDYIQACNGIQKAGYATDIEYAALLINIIHSEKLDQYDKEVLSENDVPEWARDAVAWAEKNRISDCSRLGEPATRAEVITMIFNLGRLKI